MICANGHEIERREWLSGAWRCRECHREQARRRAARKRERVLAGGPKLGSCPTCQMIPCLCEEL